MVASLIKYSTTLSKTRSTSEQRKSSETKLGEALEHDDWKNKSIKAWLITFKYHDKKRKIKNKQLSRKICWSQQHVGNKTSCFQQ